MVVWKPGCNELRMFGHDQWLNVRNELGMRGTIVVLGLAWTAVWKPGCH
jgi:hypothetical protein